MRHEVRSIRTSIPYRFNLIKIGMWWFVNTYPVVIGEGGRDDTGIDSPRSWVNRGIAPTEYWYRVPCSSTSYCTVQGKRIISAGIVICHPRHQIPWLPGTGKNKRDCVVRGKSESKSKKKGLLFSWYLNRVYLRRCYPGQSWVMVVESMECKVLLSVGYIRKHVLGTK